MAEETGGQSGQPQQADRPAEAPQDERPIPGAEPSADQSGTARTEPPEAAPEHDQADESLDTRKRDRYTRIWIQNIGVQQTGPVHGGSAFGTGRAAWVSASDGVGAVRGRVKPDELRRVGSVHVPAAVHEPAKKALADQRLVILHGRARWGKVTTALRLLDELHPGEVFLMDPTRPLGELERATFTPAAGYLVDGLDPNLAEALSLGALISTSERLEQAGSHLVVTVDGLVPLRRRALRSFLLPCDEPPEPVAVLLSALRWRLREPGLDENDPRLRRLTEPDWVRAELGNPALPVPARVHALAAVLVEVDQDRLTPDAAPTAFREQIVDQVEEWFQSHPGVRERCLMTAIAVLNESSYQDVADAAERLGALVADAADGSKDEEKEEPDAGPEPPPWRLASSRRLRVQDCCADLEASLEELIVGDTSFGQAPVDLVRLEDPVLQPAVLEHVWREHDAVRTSLLDWLDELGREPVLDVSGRAAAAVGALWKHDFRYFYNRIVLPWARHAKPDVRWSAALALDVLAADADAAKRVQGLLHKWVENDAQSAEAWTAAATYGLGIGQRYPTEALDDLLAVTRESQRSLWVVGRSLANLCDLGHADRVLAAMTAWVEDRETEGLRDRALRVFLHAARADAASAPDDQRGWPALLLGGAQVPDGRDELAALWRDALKTEEIHDWAGEELRCWLDRAEEDERLLLELDGLVAALLGRPGRAATVLRRFLRRWAGDQRHPSAAAARHLGTAKVQPPPDR
jgi:hypothetical protein